MQEGGVEGGVIWWWWDDQTVPREAWETVGSNGIAS